ncbi:M20/M25/M40 family metallo-hydrolase [bacterium]|nr:M20/M25/M40 family metallo-hydrolase [bacterium]
MNSAQDVDMQLMRTLSDIMLLNRDNGRRFEITDRIDKINALLWNSRWRRVNAQGIFHLFAAKPLKEIDKPVILVSSHIDCHKNISSCFTKFEENGLMLGTYDNCITNAAILQLMLNDRLPDNVVVAFTGDEEEESRGAKQVCRYLQGLKQKIAAAAVLDVTDQGWEQQADFTVENNFWSDPLGRHVIESAEKLPASWYFVPEDVENVPSYIKNERVILIEAECDESWDYDEFDLQCFSFCLPVCGPMHSDSGVLARRDGFVKYTEALEYILGSLAQFDDN